VDEHLFPQLIPPRRSSASQEPARPSCLHLSAPAKWRAAGERRLDASSGSGSGNGEATLANSESLLPGYPTPVWRPVQYLGSKLRSLEAIAWAASKFATPGSAVVDAFCGTAVVSQRLAAMGARVTAVDAGAAPCVWARALLGVGLPSGVTPRGHLSALLSDFERMARSEVDARGTPWAHELEVEGRFLASRDAAGLTGHELSLPQVWRPSGATPRQQEVFARWHDATRADRLIPLGFLSGVFAGSYLGLRQTLQAEAMLWAASDLHAAGRADHWQYDALRMLICHALSSASYSPGKHFAQPHKRDGRKDLTFHGERLLSDRNVDLIEATVRAAEALASSTRGVDERHAVIHRRLEDLRPGDLGSVSCLYADPPYTAQQYSRFYHLLELAVDGRARELQYVGDGAARRVTSGLYARDRFLSDFCRTSTAPRALSQLVSLAHHLRAALLLSYSGSASGSTGNRRVISMEKVLDEVGRVYGPSRVEVMDVSVAYRPFRSDSVQGRDDREYLVIANAP